MFDDEDVTGELIALATKLGDSVQKSFIIRTLKKLNEWYLELWDSLKNPHFDMDALTGEIPEGVTLVTQDIEKSIANTMCAWLTGDCKKLKSPVRAKDIKDLNIPGEFLNTITGTLNITLCDVADDALRFAAALLFLIERLIENLLPRLSEINESSAKKHLSLIHI